VNPRRGLGALAAVGIAAGLWLAHWTDVEQPRVYADSFQYLRMASEIRGDAHPDQSALQLYCAESGPKGSLRRQRCAAEAAAIDESFGPRYRAIFQARLAFPVVLAGATTLFGSAGIPLTSAAFFVGTAALLYAAIRTLGGSRIHALVAVTLFALLPSGVFAPMLLSEGALMLGICASVCGVALILRQGKGRRGTVAGVALLVGGLATACLARGAVGSSLAGALALGVLILGPRDRGRRGARRLIAGLCGGVTALSIVVPALLHQPGLTENLQLQATARFTRPDVANPWRHLLHADEQTLKAFAEDLTGHGYAVALAVLGLAGLGVVLRREAWPWLAAVAVGLASACAYPEPVASYRFLSPLWIAVAVGLGAVVDLVVTASRRPGALAAARRQTPGSPGQQRHVDRQDAVSEDELPGAPAELPAVQVRHEPDEAVGQDHSLR
jgi:hypothetical protein